MEVLRVVNRFLEEGASNQREQARLEIIDGFPETVLTGNMAGCKFVYEPKFLDDLRKRSQEDQQKVRYALEKFGELGERHPSFQTHPITDDHIECLPPGCSSSRASDELRIFWKQEEKKVHLYRFGRKGESWLQASEA